MTLNLTIVAVYLVGMLAFGWWGKTRAASSEDYLVAGRRLGPVLFTGTMAAVVLGGAATVGGVGLGYEFGLSGAWLVAAIGVGVLILSVAFAPILARLKIYTVSQMLRLRYGRGGASHASSFVMLAYTLMLAATSTGAYASIFVVLFGWDRWLSVLVGGGIVLAYSVLGGMCPRCEGRGSVSDIDLTALYDASKSLNEGAITIPGYSMEGWYGRIFRGCGYFDPDKPIAKYTKKQLSDLLYKEPTKIKVEGINVTYEGLITKIGKSFLAKDKDALQPHIRAFVDRAITFSICPDCQGTRLWEKARSSTIGGVSIADAAGVGATMAGSRPPASARPAGDLSLPGGSATDVAVARDAAFAALEASVTAQVLGAAEELGRWRW